MVATGAHGRPGANVPRMWKLEAEAQYGSSADVPVIATREALQNARDAIDQAYWRKEIERKDGRFEVIVDPVADGPIPGGYNAIRWTDNGIGMDSETFFGKFMVLGDTTKGGEGAGGFGVAKAIILGGSKTFRWRMWTRDRIYVAEGFDQPVLEYFAPSYRRGVSLTVYDLDNEHRRRWVSGHSEVVWQERLHKFLSTNDLRPQPRTGAENVRGRRKEHAGIRMYIGRGAERLQEVAPRLRGRGIPLIEREEVSNDVWLSVHAYKRKVSAGTGTYTVRLEGLTQFTNSMPSPTHLDLNVDLATTIAPGARGYPLAKSRNEIDADSAARRAVADLVRDLRQRAEDRAVDDSGKSADEYEDAPDSLDAQVAAAAAVEQQYAVLLSDPDFKARMALARGGRELLHRWSEKYGEIHARLTLLRRKRVQERERQAEAARRQVDDFYGDVPDLPPIPEEPKRPRRRRRGLEGLDAAQGERKKRARKPVWPVNPFAPTLAVTINRDFYNRARLKRFEREPAKWLRLGLVWRFACEMVLDELESSEPFRVGFIFDNDVRAGFSASENGGYTLWLNPAWFETVIKAYRDRPLNVAAVLHSKACHEVAHMVLRDLEGEYSHGRSFAIERETIADETVGILYPLSVLAAQMLDLEQPPLPGRGKRRSKGRGKGNVVLDPELVEFRRRLRGSCGCATCKGLLGTRASSPARARGRSSSTWVLPKVLVTGFPGIVGRMNHADTMAIFDETGKRPVRIGMVNVDWQAQQFVATLLPPGRSRGWTKHKLLQFAEDSDWREALVS